MREIRRLRLFAPCYQIPGPVIREQVQAFYDLGQVLRGRGLDLEVLLIDDGSEASAAIGLDAAASPLEFVTVRRHSQNLGNAVTLREGYEWLVSDADAHTVVGCCDADGEHDPLSFVRCLRLLASGDCDGVIGSIIYPPHLAVGWSQRADSHMMQFLGADQAAMMKLDGSLYIHSPGFQLHLAPFLAAAIDKLSAYLADFEKANGPAPRWGLHFVVDALLASCGARLSAAYLPCHGLPPNRDADKRWLQAEAALVHLRFLRGWLAQSADSTTRNPTSGKN